MKRQSRILLGIIVLMMIINVVAWKNAAFCDFYVEHIYPLWVSTYGWFTGLFPFSVGEIMLVAGVIVTVVAALLGLTAIVFFAYKGMYWIIHKSFDGLSFCEKVLRLCKKYWVAYTWILVGVFVIMTLNCSISFHCSTLEEKYGLFDKVAADDPMLQQLMEKEYTVRELGQLRDYVVIKCNQLAEQVERDENGNIIYPDNMEEIAIESMLRLSENCEQLGGYYPQPKQFAFSDFFSQQKMKGYFFPFSMEINYNALMHEINRPATICHEYAHLKGFMYEEEANMIGFLACINSPDVTFQYSGYLSILNYINNEFYDVIDRNKTIYASHVKISPQVRAENVFLEEKAWEKVEAKAVVKTEVVDKVSNKFSETALVINGVEDGVLSYTRVVGLLLHYYDGSPEVQETLAQAGTVQEYLVQSE